MIQCSGTGQDRAGSRSVRFIELFEQYGVRINIFVFVANPVSLLEILPVPLVSISFCETMGVYQKHDEIAQGRSVAKHLE